MRDSQVGTPPAVSGVFGGATGARQRRVRVAGCEGRRVTLVPAVSDVGDGIYDSAAVVDRVAFE